MNGPLRFRLAPPRRRQLSPSEYRAKNAQMAHKLREAFELCASISDVSALHNDMAGHIRWAMRAARKRSLREDV